PAPDSANDGAVITCASCSRTESGPAWRPTCERSHGAQRGFQLLAAERLGERVIGTQPCCHFEKAATAHVTAARHGDDLDRAVLAADRTDRLDDFLLRHDDVADHKIDALTREHL